MNAKAMYGKVHECKNCCDCEIALRVRYRKNAPSFAYLFMDVQVHAGDSPIDSISQYPDFLISRVRDLLMR